MWSLVKSGIVFILLQNFLTCHGADVFASISHLKELEEAEGHMKDVLKEYIEDEEERLEIIEHILEPISQIHERDEAKDSSDFVGHPLNAFHLIKRYVTVWPQLFAALDDTEHTDPLKDIADDYNNVLPHPPDYDGALLALLRLQKVYGLSTMQLSEGWMFHKRASPLGHEHMYDLGVAALNRLRDMDTAEEWMRTARNTERPPVADLNIVDEEYRKVRDQNKERKKIPGSSNPEEPESYKRYKNLCKKSVYEQYRSDNPFGMFCYVLTTSVPFYTHKVEILHYDPEISLIHDFVTTREARAAIRTGSRFMQRAQVGLNEEAQASDVRVGKVAFVWDEKSRIANVIGKRASSLSGLNTTYPTGEPLQIVNYGIGGQYEAHYDFDIHRDKRKEESPEMKRVGDRIATLMVYLNDVDAGGATVFPEINFYVRPVARAALFWFNYDTAGKGDPRTLHAACPVALGQKWIANKWIRQYGQELHRPCNLDDDIMFAPA